MAKSLGVLTSCLGCPMVYIHRHSGDRGCDGPSWYRSVGDGSVIPEWCPLEDAPDADLVEQLRKRIAELEAQISKPMEG